MRAINKPGTSIARMAGSHGKIVPLDENVIPEFAEQKNENVIPEFAEQISGSSHKASEEVEYADKDKKGNNP